MNELELVGIEAKSGRSLTTITGNWKHMLHAPRNCATVPQTTDHLTKEGIVSTVSSYHRSTKYYSGTLTSELLGTSDTTEDRTPSSTSHQAFLSFLSHTFSYEAHWCPDILHDSCLCFHLHASCISSLQSSIHRNNDEFCFDNNHY